jgi:hypothetical protein
MSVTVAISPRLCDALEAMRCASEFERRERRANRLGGPHSLATRTVSTSLRARKVPVDVWISNLPFDRSTYTLADKQAKYSTVYRSPHKCRALRRRPAPKRRSAQVAITTEKCYHSANHYHRIASHPFPFSPAIFETFLNHYLDRYTKPDWRRSQSSHPPPPRTISVDSQTRFHSRQ